MENSSNNDLITNYIKSLNKMELKALEIAKEQLESSFDIEKSIGYLEFLKVNEDANHNHS